MQKSNQHVTKGPTDSNGMKTDDKANQGRQVELELAENDCITDNDFGAENFQNSPARL